MARVAVELEQEFFDTLPEHAVIKIEKLRREQSEHFADMNGRYESSVIAEKRLRSAEVVRKDLIANKADEKKVKRQDRVIAEARAEVNALRIGKPLPWPNDDDLADWIARNLKNRFDSYLVKIKRPADPLGALEDVRERIADKQAERNAADNAWLPSSLAEAQAIRAIENLAASGTPDFRPAFRLDGLGASDRLRAQGNVRWPETFLNETRSIGNGLALTAWLLKDQLIARAKEEIAKLARDDEAMTLEERRKKIAQLDAEILELEREEEALVEMTAAPRRRVTDETKERPPSMLAVLGIRPA